MVSLMSRLSCRAGHAVFIIWTAEFVCPSLRAYSIIIGDTVKDGLVCRREGDTGVSMAFLIVQIVNKKAAAQAE